MREGKRSRTAEFVAFNRALGTLAPQVPGFYDPFAFHFLPDKWQKRVEQARRSLERGWRTSPYPFWHRAMGIFNQFRTVILDRAITSGPAPEQLVILGAGLDSRAWRLDALKDSVVFEVDHPASQAWKRERSAAVPYKAKDVRFVAVDFQRDQLAAADQERRIRSSEAHRLAVGRRDDVSSARRSFQKSRRLRRFVRAWQPDRTHLLAQGERPHPA